MSKVIFQLKTPNNKESSILLIYRYIGKKIVLSTGKKIAPKYWDKEKQKVKSRKAEHKTIQNWLNFLANTFDKILLSYKHQGITPPIDELKRNFKEAIGEGNKTAHKSFIEFVEDFITEREKSVSPKYSKSIITVYRTTLKTLQLYSKRRYKTLDFDSITLNFYNDFTKYLADVKKIKSINSIDKYIKTIKTMMGEAYKRGLHDNTAYQYFKRMSEATDAIYLNSDEIEQLYKCDLSQRKNLEKVRDIFVVGCLTGLRFSDFSTLQKSNIKKIGNKKIVTEVKLKNNDQLYEIEGKITNSVLNILKAVGEIENVQEVEKKEMVEVIDVTTIKTGAQVVIPIKPLLRRILEKYSYRLPKSISNQKTNEHLKTIGELAELSQEVTLNKGGTKLTAKKYQLITTHTARRSFATNAYLSHVPTISLMKITGHKTEKAFLKYIKVSNLENALHISKHPFFNS